MVNDIVPLDEIPDINILEELRSIIAYNSAIQRRMLQMYVESEGEVFDSRMLGVQKMIVSAAKMLKELDPDIRRQEIELQAEADLALEIFRKKARDERLKNEFIVIDSE